MLSVCLFISSINNLKPNSKPNSKFNWNPNSKLNLKPNSKPYLVPTHVDFSLNLKGKIYKTYEKVQICR